MFIHLAPLETPDVHKPIRIVPNSRSTVKKIEKIGFASVKKRYVLGNRK